ncbi:MAG: glycosyltransferase [Methanobacteriota archaeon]
MVGNPLVSIVIPVYNGSDYLKWAIDSALGQTYKNIEVVVVDDGSNDGGKTDAICKSYGDKIVHRRKPNGGVASALNDGIRSSKGKYISWLSHDDMYTPDKLEKQIQFLSEYRKLNGRECIPYSNYVSINVVENTRIPVATPAVPPEEFFEALVVAEHFSIHGCTTLIPKQAFDKVGLFDERLKTTQDYDMWFKLNTEYDFVQTGDFFVESRDHPLQGTKTMKSIHSREKDEMLISALNYHFKNEASEKYAIKRYGYVALSFKKRGLTGAYEYSMKMRASRKGGLTGRDVLYIIYSLIYFHSMLRSGICDRLDRVMSVIVG